MAPIGRIGHRRVVAGGLAGLLAVGVLAGCGSSGKTSASPVTSARTTTTAAAPAATTTTSTVPTTAASTTVAPTTVAPTTAVPATTAPTTSPPTAPPVTSVVGLTLSGAGNTFTAPAAPTTMPYSTNCQTLIDPGFSGQCVIVTAPTGTIAAIVEQQEGTYQPGQPIVAGQDRDLVYRDVSNTWSLVLRRIPAAAGEAITQVYGSDIIRDGDPKAVFVEPAANSAYGNELDVVEGSGVVTLYRQLHGGFATVPAGGDLETYVPDPVDGYDEATISYTGGAWTIISSSHVSDSQAQSLTSQSFFDAQAIQASY